MNVISRCLAAGGTTWHKEPTANVEPRGAVSFPLNPRKRPSIVPHDRPGNPNPTENNRGKQGRSICTPAKRLLGTGTQTPVKRRQRRPFSLPLTGRLCVLPDVVSILLSSRSSLPYSAPARARSRSTCGAFGKAAKRPLPGDWGRPPTSGFYRFSPRRKSGKSQSVYHFALLSTIESG